MKKVGYIGNFYKIPEYIMHSTFELDFVIVEHGYLSDEMLTFLKVRDISYCELKHKDEIVEIINNRTDIDFWITCSYGKRIPMEKMPSINIYNIHYAALPYYKGRHPTFYATMANEKEIGISLHQVTSSLDEGKIIAQEIVPYYIWEDENALFDKLTQKVPELLEDLNKYMHGVQQSYIENKEGSYYKPVILDDITIDIESDTATDNYNKVRAQAKYKGAYLKYDGKEYWIKKVLFSQNNQQGAFCIKKEDYYVVFYTE